MKMEGGVRSGVLKKKTSSGCLIIKKKGVNNNFGGFRGLVNSKEKKRPRLVLSDLSSSSSGENESSEFMRRKVKDNNFENVSVGYRQSGIQAREYGSYNGRMEGTAGSKRSRVDLLEFDGCHGFDGERMANEYRDDRFKMVRHRSGENLKEFESGSLNQNVVEDKQKHSLYFDGSSNGDNNGVDISRQRSKGFGLEEDEANLRTSLLRMKNQEMMDKTIRLQGKNGVLKVMANRKKKIDIPSQLKICDPMEVQEIKSSCSESVIQETYVQSSLYLAPKPQKKGGLLVDQEKNVEEKKEQILERAKPLLSRSSKAIDSESDETYTSLKLLPPAAQTGSSKKAVTTEEEKSPPPANVTPVKGKEVKAKRGGSTEKQMLREKIRGMLVGAGWTIDYRPRKNRDYLDAVYINPSGTAYWSIIKAYDALKKQLDEDNNKTKSDVGSSSFAPLSEDLINKLTRQTKKKIEEEMKRKRKDGSSKNAEEEIKRKKKCGSSKNAKEAAVKETAESSNNDQNDERNSPLMKQNCNSWKCKLQEVDQLSGDDLSDYSKRKSKKGRIEERSNATSSKVTQGRISKKIGRCTLLVRSSDREQNSNPDGYVPYTGKRTVLAWLIDSGTAQLSEKVQYMNRKRTRVMLEGWITRDGIHCGCCSKILTVSKFELHAGSKLRQPFQNIFLESGPSLLQCKIDAWLRQEKSLRQDFHTVDANGDDPDDDTCCICGDGGDLICCDSCPSTFHQNCLDIQMLPSGDWHCPTCICKFCGDVSGNVAEENDRTVGELVRCGLCEKNYHKLCSEAVDAVPLSSNGAVHSFCGKKCQELYEHLQKILGIKHELEGGFTWTLIRRTDLEDDTSRRGFPQRVECNAKLAVASSITDECFLPIIDRRSGINIIHNVVYNCGSNFNRLNYRGFYMAILERSDEIISAASIRIHGMYLAEMPFIGTREIYRRQGMCRRLLSAIESTLCSLEVKKLVIPAITEHTSTWTTVFGFHQVEDELKKEMKFINMLVFPGTDMLQKQLAEQKVSDGTRAKEFKENQHELPDLDAYAGSCMKEIRQVNGDVELCHQTLDGSETLLSPLAEANQSPVWAGTSNAGKISCSAPCLGSVRNSTGETSSMAEEPTENLTPSVFANIGCLGEHAMPKLGTDDPNVGQTECKSEAASDVSSGVEVSRTLTDMGPSVEVADYGDIDAYVNGGCIESSEETAERLNRQRSSATLCAPTVGKDILQGLSQL